MDDLLRDFITETNEHLAAAEAHLVAFERDPGDTSLVASIFRLVHTIKGTAGFLGLDALMHVAHASETLLGRMRDGEPPTSESVTLVLLSIDRIRAILAAVDAGGSEPPGAGDDIVAAITAHLSGPPVGRETGAGGPDDAEHAAPAAAPSASVPEVGSDDPAARATEAAEARPGGGEPKAGPKGGARGAGTTVSAGASGGPGGETIRVAVSVLEGIMQLVSELVLARNQLHELTRNTDSDSLKLAQQRISGLTTDLQDAVMRARLQPVARLFGGLPRLVRELSNELGKSIRLVTEGAETELDRQLIEVIRDPVTHIIRNCADHGIESREQRLAAGKPEEGEIRVRAAQEAGQFVIEIADDGKGIDVARVKAKALTSGLASAADLAQMSDEEVCQLVFEPGFSTAEKVTSVSGRGVGMDVVKTNIEAVKGTATLASTHGKGTRFTLRVPLTLAIAPALILQVGERRLALPQHCVHEVVEARRGPDGCVKTVQSELVVDLRGSVMPATELAGLLGIAPAKTEGEAATEVVAVVRTPGGSVGLIVDGVLDVQEIVVKPLNRSLRHLDIYSGQTILGDGSVLLILDPAGIARRLGVAAAVKANQRAAVDDARKAETRMIVFRAGAGSLKVIPISFVSRIEQADPGRFSRTDTGLVLLFEDRLVPTIELVPLDSLAGGPVSVVIMSISGLTVGLIVEEIVDIVADVLDIETTGSDDRIIGTCRIGGTVVDMVDPVHLAGLADARRVAAPSPGARSLLLVAAPGQSVDLIVPFLAASGYAVTTAASVEEARAIKSSGRRFDAILADMPAPSAAAELKSWSEWAGDVPLIGLADEAMDALQSDGQRHRIAARLDRRGLIRALASTRELAA